MPQVGITGSYAGAGIQYVVPAALVHQARRQARAAIGVGVTNQHRWGHGGWSWWCSPPPTRRSPFSSERWVWFVQAWAATSVVLVTWNHCSAALGG